MQPVFKHFWYETINCERKVVINKKHPKSSSSAFPGKEQSLAQLSMLIMWNIVAKVDVTLNLITLQLLP